MNSLGYNKVFIFKVIYPAKLVKSEQTLDHLFVSAGYCHRLPLIIFNTPGSLDGAHFSNISINPILFEIMSPSVCIQLLGLIAFKIASKIVQPNSVIYLHIQPPTHQ